MRRDRFGQGILAEFIVVFGMALVFAMLLLIGLVVMFGGGEPSPLESLPECPERHVCVDPVVDPAVDPVMSGEVP